MWSRGDAHQSVLERGTYTKGAYRLRPQYWGVVLFWRTFGLERAWNVLAVVLYTMMQVPSGSACFAASVKALSADIVSGASLGIGHPQRLCDGLGGAPAGCQRVG